MMTTTSLLQIAFTIATGSFLLACGGTDDGLDRDTVTDLPSGSGTGTAASGNYRAEVRTTGCSGVCQPGACREGSVSGGNLALVQRDGYLSMTAPGGVMEGGIEKDGSFEVGGWTTIQSGALQQAFRSDGVHTGSGFSAQTEARRWGTYENLMIDCTESGILTATRL